LWIINSRAEVLQKITFNLPGLYNLRWLDNQSMIFETGQTSKDGTVIFFNPFTREQHYVSYDLPNFYQIQYNELIPWFVEYSHDMDFVVYLSRSEDGRTGPVLWDVNTHQAIWQRMDAGLSVVTPLWSPTHETVAVIDNNRQLYIIDQHGNTRRLPESGTHYMVTSFSWSPDSNAFFIGMRVEKDDGSFAGATIFVDVTQNLANRISRQLKPLDWMNSIP